MAITNAQQYKQLLAKGGRIGLKGGADASTVGFDKSYDRANPRGANAPRSVNISPGGGVTTSSKAPGQAQEYIGGKPFDLNPQSKEAIEQKNLAISIANDKKRTAAKKRALKERTFLEKLGKLGTTDRNLDSKLEKIGAIDKQFGTIGGLPTGFIGSAIGALTVDPATNYFDEDSIREIGGVLSKSKTGITKSQANTLGDIREDIQMRGRIQDPNDNVTQSEFEEYMNKPPEIIGGEGIQDPCKGPNPPAYCFTGLRSAEAATPEVEEEDEIINYRLMADGGRAAFAGGGKDAGAGSNFGNENFGNSGDGRPNMADIAGPVTTTRGPKTRSGDGGNEPNTPVIANPNFSFGKNIGKGLDPKELARFFNEFYGLNSDDDDETKNTVTVGSEINTPAGAFVTTDNAIDTVFSPTIASGVQTVFGTGLDKRTDMYDRVLEADGGRIGLAEGGMPYEGGIMDLESSRQMYGLGKLVKKITRGVKKIAKSPIGKAAIVGGLGYLANSASGGAFSKFFKDSIFGKVTDLGISGANRSARTGGLLDFIKKNKMLTGLAGTTALSYFMTPEEEEEQKLYAGADIDDPSYIMNNPSLYTNRRLAAEGGSMDEPVAKKTMPLLDMDGKEMDLREEGGFVPLGRMEKADDVPARLSKNEFVFTADAVRNAGEGDVDKGAEVMYNMMKNLESGGDVSEESQGLEGARDMFQTSQRLEEVL